MCVYKKRGCYIDQVDLKHVRMWIVHKPTTTKDEGHKTNMNKRYTIPIYGIPNNS
jgi:hypothetical protein